MDFEQRMVSREAWLVLTVALLLAVAMVAIFAVAPQEKTMGDTQRIVYLHVSVAWFGLLGFLCTAAAGSMYLWRRSLAWDYWAQAAGEVGWMCATLTLITGSLWAHEAWNTWWTWDPRLTSSLILWTVYSGYFIVRGSIEDRHVRARVGAILSLVGAIDVPLVVMATRWFRGIHPVSPEMEPAMHVVLLLAAVVLTAFFLYLVVKRQVQLTLAGEIDNAERSILFTRRPS
jgi:heme exporter protein C